MKLLPDISSLTQAIAYVEQLGFTHEFVAVEEGMKDLVTKKVYAPESLVIKDVFRFEGYTDPDDLSVLYVLEASDGVRGWVSDAYGPYASPVLAEHLDKMKYEPEN